MSKQVYVQGNYGMDTLAKTIGTLRRKQIEVSDVYLKETGNNQSDIFITLKNNDFDNVQNVKELLEKLYCLDFVQIIE
jgi:hypothetical protein